MIDSKINSDLIKSDIMILGNAAHDLRNVLAMTKKIELPE